MFYFSRVKLSNDQNQLILNANVRTDKSEYRFAFGYLFFFNEQVGQ